MSPEIRKCLLFAAVYSLILIVLALVCTPLLYSHFMPQRGTEWIKAQVWLNIFFAGFLPVSLLAFVLALWVLGADSRAAVVRVLNTGAWIPLVLGLQFGVICYVRFAAFDDAPHVADEITYVFQSRVYATGRLSIDAPPSPVNLSAHYVKDEEGRQFGLYPYGWPGLLSLGVRIGAPWLVNTLLGLGVSLLVYRLTRMYCSLPTARLALGITALSPILNVLAATYMTHVAAMFFLLLFISSYIAAEQRGGRLQWLWAGIGLGAAAVTRPYTALVLALPWILHSAWCFFTWKKDAVWRNVLIVGAVLLFLAGQMAVNRKITGSPLQLPASKWVPQDAVLGFRDLVPASGLPFGPKEAVQYTFAEMFMMGNQTFGWPLVCWLPAFLLLFYRGKTLWDWLLMASILAHIAGFFIWPWLNCLYGPRYYSELLICFAPLTARTLYLWLAGNLFAWKGDKAGTALIVWIPCALVFYIIVMPHYSRAYLNEDPSTFDVVRTKVKDRAVVFFLEDRVEGQPTKKEKYPATRWDGLFLRNSLDYQSDIIMARSVTPEDDLRLMQAYPDRAYYTMRYDKTEKQYVIIPYVKPPVK